jgi:hypothetical protein
MRLLELLLGIGIAAAQTNPPSVPYNPAWLYKVDVRNGTLTNPTITGGTVTGQTLTSPTITTPTVTGGTFATPALATPAITGGTISGATITTSTLSGNVVGTTTNNNAPAGDVGEYISSTVLVGGAIALTSLFPADITAISLTAGDWDVRANFATNPNAATVTTQVLAAISLVSATMPAIPNGGAYTLVYPSSAAGSIVVAPTGTMRLSLASTTIVYLTVDTQFSVNTLSGYGFIGARRVR